MIPPSALTAAMSNLPSVLRGEAPELTEDEMMRVLEAAFEKMAALDIDLWRQASVVSGYYDRHRADNQFTKVCNGDLRMLGYLAHGVPTPPAKVE